MVIETANSTENALAEDIINTMTGDVRCLDDVARLQRIVFASAALKHAGHIGVEYGYAPTDRTPDVCAITAANDVIQTAIGNVLFKNGTDFINPADVAIMPDDRWQAIAEELHTMEQAQQRNQDEGTDTATLRAIRDKVKLADRFRGGI